MSELTAYWTANHALCRHVVLIAREGGGTVSFLDERDVSGAQSHLPLVVNVTQRLSAAARRSHPAHGPIRPSPSLA